MIWNSLDYKIIDMHTHMGPEYPLYYPDYDVDDIVKFLDEANVEFIISSPCEDLFRCDSRREVIMDAMMRYPKRIKGYYGVNPKSEVCVDDMLKAFTNNPGYTGIKLLPDYHRTALTDSAYEPFLEFANHHHMLVLSHTWGLSMHNETYDSADITAIILDKYPNIRFIMGHSIQGQIDEAIALANYYPNAYLDLCDTGRINGVIEKMTKKAGASKVVFGTDLPMQSTWYVFGAVMHARISNNERRLILRDNAIRILSEVYRPDC